MSSLIMPWILTHNVFVLPGLSKVGASPFLVSGQLAHFHGGIPAEGWNTSRDHISKWLPTAATHSLYGIDMIQHQPSSTPTPATTQPQRSYPRPRLCPDPIQMSDLRSPSTAHPPPGPQPTTTTHPPVDALHLPEPPARLPKKHTQLRSRECMYPIYNAVRHQTLPNSAAAEPFENLCSCGYSGRPDRRNNPLPRILLPFPVINVDKKNVSLINLRRK